MKEEKLGNLSLPTDLIYIPRNYSRVEIQE
jgi:hypothetical protein